MNIALSRLANQRIAGPTRAQPGDAEAITAIRRQIEEDEASGSQIA